jgi:hypothetical protein
MDSYWKCHTETGLLGAKAFEIAGDFKPILFALIRCCPILDPVKNALHAVPKGAAGGVLANKTLATLVKAFSLIWKKSNN